MSAILEKVRDKYPQYESLSDDDLAIRVGTKYPTYLDQDSDFKKEYEGAVVKKGVELSVQAPNALLNVLNNPAAAEAAAMGREQEAPPVPKFGPHQASGTRFAPSISKPPEADPNRPNEIRPRTFGEKLSALMPETKLPYEIEAERSGITEKTNVANALRDLLGGLIKPESMALLLTGAGEAQLAKLSPKLADAAKKVISGYFAWQGVKGVEQELPEAFKPGKTFSERLGHLTTAGASGAIAIGAGTHMLSEAAKIAEPIAPMTAAAVREQSVEPSKMPQDAPEAPKTPPAPETPAVPPAEQQAAPSWQITAASYTDRKTGRVTTAPNHIEAAKLQGKNAPKIPTNRHGDEYGFEVVDPATGKKDYVSRDKAEEIARANGQLLKEPERGKLHSDEVEYYKPEEKGQENALEPETAQPVRLVRDTPGEGAGEMPVEGAVPKDDEGGGKKTPEPEAPKEQVAKPAAAKAERLPDLIDELKDAFPRGINITSKSDYANLVRKATGRARKLLFIDKPGAESLDTVMKAQELKGTHYESQDELINAILNAGESLKGVREDKAAGAREESTGEDNLQKFEDIALHNKGRNAVQKRAAKPVAVEDLKVGSTFTLKGEKFTVPENGIDPDTGEVKVTSKKYGDQVLRDGETFYPDKGEVIHPPEEDAGFGQQESTAEEISKETPADQEKPAAPTVEEKPPEAAVVPPKPKVQERPLTKAEQNEFADLSIKARRAREQGEAALTTEETKRYEHLTALSGQQELLGEDAMSGARSRIKTLREKADEMDRLRIRTQERAFESLHRREELFKEARTYQAEAEKARDEASKLESGLPEFQEEQRNRVVQREQQREAEAAAHANGEDLFGAWPKPQNPEPPAPFTQTKEEFAEQASPGETPDPDFHEAAVQAAVENNQPVPPEVLEQYPVLKEQQEQAMPPASKEPVKVGEIDPNQRYRIGSSPQPYQLLERLEPSEVERLNNEQPVRIKNVKTGKEEIALESQLEPIRTLSAEERKAAKGMSKKDLDDALRKVGLDPSVFKTIGQKKAALRREQAKLHGPGSPSLQQGPDPKEEIQQLEEAFRNIEGKKVSPLQRAQMAWDEGIKRLAAGKDDLAQALAGLKTVGDRVIRSWKGYNLLDDLLKAKGDLSATIESRGWLNRKFSERVKKQFPDPKERAAIRKYVDAGGDMTKLQQGLAEAPQQYKQAYQDAMNLSPDAKVGAENIRSYFESRLQEAIDYGILKDGVEDYIHRIYERDPAMAAKMFHYTQSALLKTNPRLALKRIFQNDWEAEKLGYKVVQDFLPAITEYETSLSKAIAARSFIKKANELKAPDGRPVLAVKGVGVPITDPNGIRQQTIIKPHSTPGKNNDPAQPLKYRGDYVERPEYGALRKWKWLGKDSAGKPIFMQGDVAVHPDFVGRIDKLLKPSELRFSRHPGIAAGSKLALGLSSAIKQTMLDFSGFHQVQIAIHALEHRVQPGSLTIPKTGISIPLPKIPGFTKVMRDIDLTDTDTQGLLRGGVTLGGEYRSSAISEGLVGRSISRAIPGVADVMSTYHSWLFQDFIPRIKMTMAKEAFGRNMQRFKKEILSGKMTKDDVYFETAKQANGAFGALNYTMLERSKTIQDLSRLVFLAPDFLEARGKFAAQAFAKHGTEQRMALFLGAATLWTVARAMNLGLNGQMHNEKENLFSVVYKNKSYSLRTVQGDILHMLDNPLQFWMSRLNPVYGRSLLELASGRDYFGRKRSYPEQAWDFVSTAIPVSLRTGSERKLWESLMNGMGVNARRWSDTDDAFKLAQKWKNAHGVGGKGEFIYDPDKDDLRKLKIALSNSDEGGATREIKKLIESKKYTFGKLTDYFNRYSNMPFTGSFANDRKFEATLSDDQKITVRAAKDHKKAMKALYQSARDKYRSALAEPAPAPEESPVGQE